MKNTATKAVQHIAWFLALLLCSLPVMADDIDSTDKHAWSENTGWANYKDDNSAAAVYADHLEGYVWAENIGWIRLGTYTDGGAHTYDNNAADNYGVNRNGTNLSGYAWSENTGWIKFDDSNGGVSIDADGIFDGYAWGENTGWIHFQNASPAYRVRVLQPSVTLSLSGSPLAENSGIATVTAILSNPSSLDVTVNLSFSGTAAGTDYSKSDSIVISAGNTLNTMTITGTEDALDEDDETVIVDISSVTNGTESDSQQVTATITESLAYTAGITVNPVSGLMTNEFGAQADFTVILDSEPAADVNIGISSSNPDEGAVSPAGLTFTPDNWNIAQTVTVTGVDDSPPAVDGNIAYTVVMEPAVSGDGQYNGLDPNDVSVTNNDDDGEPQLPEAIFTATPSAASLTVELNADASFDPDGIVADYQWSSSDGQSVSGVQTSLSFNTAGSYDITLEVTDNDGLTAKAEQTIQVPAALTEINFLDTRVFYYAKNTVNIVISEMRAKEPRSQPVDLWVVVQIPGGEIFFASPASVFSLEPQAFKTGIAPSETEHLVFESGWPFTEKGEYTLYAVYVREGADPLTGNFLDMMRSNLASFTFDFFGLAEINFDGMQESYETGETVSITVAETQAPRPERVDLWVAVVQMPSRATWFRTSSPLIPFSPKPQAFKAGVEPSDTIHPVFEFEVPPGSLEGEYTFYALYVQEKADPLAKGISIIRRSNLAAFQLQFE